MEHDVRLGLPCVPRVNATSPCVNTLVVFSTHHNPRWELTFGFVVTSYLVNYMRVFALLWSYSILIDLIYYFICPVVMVTRPPRVVLHYSAPAEGKIRPCWGWWSCE